MSNVNDAEFAEDDERWAGVKFTVGGGSTVEDVCLDGHPDTSNDRDSPKNGGGSRFHRGNAL